MKELSPKEPHIFFHHPLSAPVLWAPEQRTQRDTLLSTSLYFLNHSDFDSVNRLCNMKICMQHIRLLLLVSAASAAASRLSPLPAPACGPPLAGAAEASCLALLSLAQLSGLQAWTSAAGWASSQPHCSWQGVACSTDGNVTELCACCARFFWASVCAVFLSAAK